MQVYLPLKFHGNSLSCWIYISRLVVVYKTLQQFCYLLYGGEHAFQLGMGSSGAQSRLKTG